MGNCAGDRYQSQVFSKLELLREQPFLGSRVSDTSPEVRVLRVEQLIALYSVDIDQVLVLRLLHVRQELPPTE